MTNPGDPEATDPEATSPEAAEEAIAEVEPDLDQVIEPDDVAVEEEAVDPAHAGSDLEAELAERTEDLQRLSAEYTNYRRRTERERKAAIDGAKAQVVSELLPIMDDLGLAAKHGDLEEGPLKGFADKFQRTLTGLGLEAFGEEGDEFDPEIHEAVQDTSTGEEKVLGTVLRQGYRLGERTLRTAMVIIADSESED